MLKINPENPKAVSSYAKALVLNHNVEKAIELMEDLLDKFPSDEEFQINLAYFGEIGNFAKSKNIIDTGFKSLFNKRQNNERVKNLIQFFAQYASDKNNELLKNEIDFFTNRLSSGDLNIDQEITLAKAFFEYFRNIKEL